MRTATFLAAFAASAISSLAAADFGQIPVAMTSGTGVGTDGYYNNTFDTGYAFVNVGIKAHEYRNGNMPAGSTTQSAIAGGGTWLNLDSSGRYTAIAGVAANKPSWNPNAPSWGFTWSISAENTGTFARPTAGHLLASMVITRPDTVAVNVFTDVDAAGNFGGDPTNPVWQNNWNLGYLGVFGSGVDANTLGEWKIRLDIKEITNSGNVFAGSQEITVNVVPAPGALALLGAAGLGGSRRRRA